MAIYFGAKQVIRIQFAAKAREEENDLYLIETEGAYRYCTQRKRITADGGVEEIVRTANQAKGNLIQQGQLPLYRKTA